MRVLAIDSSGLVATVAIVEEQQTIAEYTVNYKKTHSQTLLPMIDEIVRMTESELDTVDAIAISGGPGSFTGLRIGSATAKGLGLALDKPLIHVPTLSGLAYQVYAWLGVVCPIMDARRGQVYSGIYEFVRKGSDAEDCQSKHFLQTIREECAIPMEELIAELNELRQPVLFLGDGVPVHEETLKEKMQTSFTFAPAYMNRQRASAVGALSIELFKEGKVQLASEHVPDYLRVSQAERERKKREEQSKPSIREWCEGDFSVIATLEQEIFSDAWSLAALEDTNRNPNAKMFVAEREGKLLGYLLLYCAADEAEIVRIAVKEEVRRQGISQVMMDAMLDWCRTNRISKLMLDVRCSNEQAIALYRKNGFVEDGTRKNFYKQPDEDALLMSRTI